MGVVRHAGSPRQASRRAFARGLRTRERESRAGFRSRRPSLSRRAHAVVRRAVPRRRLRADREQHVGRDRSGPPPARHEPAGVLQHLLHRPEGARCDGRHGAGRARAVSLARPWLRAAARSADARARTAERHQGRSHRARARHAAERRRRARAGGQRDAAQGGGEARRERARQAQKGGRRDHQDQAALAGSAGRTRRDAEASGRAARTGERGAWRRARRGAVGARALGHCRRATRNRRDQRRVAHPQGSRRAAARDGAPVPGGRPSQGVAAQSAHRRAGDQGTAGPARCRACG